MVGNFKTYEIELHYKTSCKIQVVADNKQEAINHAYDMVNKIDIDNINNQPQSIKLLAKQLIKNRHTQNCKEEIIREY